MRTLLNRARLITTGGLLAASAVLLADGTRFSDFTPLATSATPTLDESQPILLGNPQFWQRSIANRQIQLSDGKSMGAWDMNTVNETGRHKGRYVFTVFTRPVRRAASRFADGRDRHDLDQAYGQPTTLVFDPSFWTPWGTLIVGEESWVDRAGGCTTKYGRFFELKNPLDAPGFHCR